MWKGNIIINKIIINYMYFWLIDITKSMIVKKLNSFCIPVLSDVENLILDKIPL